MAATSMFGEDEEDVGPFVMAEDGEEWFPFTLDNLEEMDAEQNSLRPMQQEAVDYGETDSDNDVDSNSAGAEASGPGPPDMQGNVEGGGGTGDGRVANMKRARSGESNISSRGNLDRGVGGGARRVGRTGASGAARAGGGGSCARLSAVETSKQACSVGVQESLVPPPKGRLDKIKAEAKEVHQATLEQRKIEEMLKAETQAQAKRNGKGEARRKEHTSGKAGGGGDLEGTSGRRDSPPWSTFGGGVAGRSSGGGRSRNKSSSSSTTTTSLTTASCTTSDAGGGIAGGRRGSGGGGSSGIPGNKVTSVQNRRRLERNAREQKRSLKISQRIEDLRRMLSQFGVDVKTSKSAVLSEATDYIAHLQRQQAHFEAERARMLQLLHQANQRAADAGAAGAPLLAGAAAVPATTAGIGDLVAGVDDPQAFTASGEGAAGAAIGKAGSNQDFGTLTGAEVCPGTGDTVKPLLSRMGSGSGAMPLTGLPASTVKLEAEENAGVGGASSSGPTPLLPDAAAASWQEHEQPQQRQRQRQRQRQQLPQSSSGPLLQDGVAAKSAAGGNIAPTPTSNVTNFTGLSAPGGRPNPVTAGQALSAPGGAGVMGVGVMLPESSMQLQTVGTTGGTIQQMATAGGVGVGGGLGVGFGGVGAPIELATARALSHVNYERVFRTATVPMAIANVNGNLVDCNASLTQATGFRREEALFMTIFDLVADPFLQHTFSMISSILSLRGVASPPFFQVLGKRRDGSPGGLVQISVVQDEALRPMHFSICILESSSGAGFMPNTAAGATVGGMSTPGGPGAAASLVGGDVVGSTS